MHLVTIIGIWILRAIGLLLLYSAIFLHEDEEGGIQNLIESWWVRVDDSRVSAVKRSASFFKIAAEIAGRGLSVIFGERLISARVICVSVCFSFASWELVSELISARHSEISSRSLEIIAGFVALGLASGLIHSRGILRIWMSCVVGAILLWLANVVDFFRHKHGSMTFYEYVGIVTLACLLSAGIDVLCLFAIRWLLRRATMVTKPMVIIGLFLLNGLMESVLALTVFVSLSYRYSSAVILFIFAHAGQDAGDTIIMMSMMSIFDLLACSYVAVVMSMMLIHLFAWPVIERPLYALARFGIIKQKKLLWTVGGALLVGPPNLIGAGHWLLAKILSSSA